MINLKNSAETIRKGALKIIPDAFGIIKRPLTTLREIKKRSLSEVFVFIFLTAFFYSVLLSAAIFFDIEPIINYDYFKETGLLNLIFLMYFLTIINFFVNAVFIHIFVIIVEGKNGLFESLKAVCYSSSPALFLGWIPVVGIITGIWALIIQTAALRELHDISTGRAVLAMILPYIIFICIFISLYFIPAPFSII